MNAALQPLGKTLTLQTRLFENCLDGVDDDRARERLDGRTNHLAFIVCHLVDARFFLARLLGSAVESPFKELEDVRRVEDMRVVPALAELRAAWTQVTGILSARFEEISASELAAQTEQEFPIDDGTLLGAIAFLLHHEAYHIGQMGMLHKSLGLGPMRYE